MQSTRDVENEVELRCQKLPEIILANGFRWHCSLEHQVVATPCKLAKMSSVTWQLIATRRLYRTKTMIRHVHFIWSMKKRYKILDATITVKSLHVFQPQWMNNASGCYAQFEQHRKVHLIDETYCSCVCFLVFHVDLCRRAVHDFDGTLHADTNDSLRHSVTASCTVGLGPLSMTGRSRQPDHSDKTAFTLHTHTHAPKTRH